MLLLAVATFVGSQACGPCHGAIAEAYAKTPMARSAGRAEPLAHASFVAAGHRYGVEGNRLTFESGSSTIDYYVGSNTAGRTWLREFAGYLFELPITWYAQKARWDASPGYEKEPWVRLSRPVEPSCLQCHASRVRPVRGTQNRYGDPPFLEGGVSCERCHGPGSEHVRDPAAASMVNPARLDHERREDICSQCHLTGEARIEKAGRQFAEFQAGQKLIDYATYLVWKGGRRDFKVTSHVEKLAGSRCRTASGDSLSCTTCHEPHSNLNRTQEVCLGCHAAAHRREENCADCHMPKTKSSDANHGVLTDHSIPRLPSQKVVPGGTGELEAFTGLADARALGLAYAEMGDRRARAYLERATSVDWQVRLRLAAMEPGLVRAAALYEAVLKERPGEVSALVNLGSIYGQAGRTADAIRLWRRALEANPALEEAALNLSEVLPAAEGAEILRQYLGLNPASPAGQARAAELAKALLKR
jgi:Cytochrome c554 and c-prime